MLCDRKPRKRQNIEHFKPVEFCVQLLDLSARQNIAFVGSREPLAVVKC